MANVRDVVSQLLSSMGVENPSELSSADAKALLTKKIAEGGPIESLSNEARRVLDFLEIPYVEKESEDPAEVPVAAEESPKATKTKKPRKEKRQKTKTKSAPVKTEVPQIKTSPTSERSGILARVRAVMVLAGGTELSNNALTEMPFGEVLDCLLKNGGEMTVNYRGPNATKT